MQLKNIFYSAMLAIAAPLTTYGQAGLHELSLSYGTISGTQLIDGVTTTTQYNSIRQYTKLQTSNTGNIFLTYRYGVVRGFDIGFTLGVQHYAYEGYPNYSTSIYPPGSQPAEASYNVTVVTYAVEFKPAYYTGEYFQLYGFLGIGVRNYHNESNPDMTSSYTGGVSELPTYFINTQWTPFGVRFGKTLSGFAEFGFGYKGLGNMGISYKLNGHPMKKAPAEKNISTMPGEK